MNFEEFSDKERKVLQALENGEVFSYPHLSAQARILPSELSDVLQALRQRGLVIERLDSRVIGGKVIAISENGYRKLQEKMVPA
jgi:hypothetical protein